jgi:hypothetical protein
MALPTVSLDDRTFDQLFDFMRKQIDTVEWVDHNLSDPGIVLLDLLCWIGEMILYRADRVPRAYTDKFTALILDPPEPVTVPLTLTATLDAARTVDLTVPAGTRFATDFHPDPSTGRPRRFVFETIAPVTFLAPQNPPPPGTSQAVTVTAREFLAVANESLGTSDGSPDKVFPLRPVHTDLGLPLDRPAPVLTDFVHRSATYDPNPRVSVAGQPWELRRFLLTEQSYIDPANPQPARHFMVDPDGAIRFGDGRFGSIPPAGAAIVCTRYQLLQGPDALVAAGTVVHRLDAVAGLTATESIAIDNGDAEGGDFFFAPADRVREGLKRFRRPYRLITASDFEEVLRIDFNELQSRAQAPDRILRAVALMNRRPTAPDQPAPGNVTIVVLAARSGVDLDDALTDPTLGDQQKQALVDPAPLVEKLRRFLDGRRLITTRVHLSLPPPQPVLPVLIPVSITTTVVVDPERNTAAMTDVVRRRLRAFLGVVHGGFDGKGWPLGGSVYRSKLFRLLEDLDGVDHVEALTLAPADANGDVALDPLSLPALALNGLSVTVVRA